MPNNYFFKHLFGALPKIFDWIRKYGLKKSSSFKKSAILMAKMAKKCQKLVMKFFWTPKTPFFV